MLRFVPRASAFALLLAVAASCGGGDGGGALTAVRADEVPTGTPGPGPEGTLSVDDGCVRVGNEVLAFVEDQASLDGENLKIERQVDGAGHLALLPIGQPVPQLLGFLLQRHGGEWAEKPPAGCGGPWFVVTEVVPTENS